MSDETPHPPIDESLRAIRRMLAGIRRSTRGWIWAESLGTVACVCVAGLWATLAIDRVVEPPVWARGLMIGGLAAVVAYVLVTRLMLRLAAPLDDESLALVVERTHPAFGDALSTAVSCGLRGEEPVDRELMANTAAAAAGRLRDVRSAAIFRRGRLAAVVAAGAAAVGLTAAVAWLRPIEAATWSQRMLRLADQPWPRRITFHPQGFADGRRVVARGDTVEVLARAVAAWGQPPEFVELRTRPVASGSSGRRGGWRSERMGPRGGATPDGQVFGHVLERIDGDLELEIRGDDGRIRGLRLAVEDPPAVAAFALSYTPPAYLGGGPRTVPASRIVAVPRGAVVDLRLDATKPLAAASMAIRRATDAGDEILARLPADGVGATSIAARTPPIDGDATVLVQLTDAAGLTNREPVAVVLAAIPDEPPRVAIRLAGISTAITPQAVLPMVGTISDDHALDAVAVRLAAGESTTLRPLGRVAAGATLLEFSPDRPERIALADAGLAVGGRLAVTVLARDRCGVGGGPQESAGETWTLDVVAPEALLAMLEAREVLLRRRLEAVIDDLAKARELAAVDQTTGASDLLGVCGRCGDAASRAAGETGEISAEFLGIHQELTANGLATPELQTRLVGQIAEPLAAIAANELAAAMRTCREAAATDRRSVMLALDAAIARLRGVLARMLELESVNEVIERLRGVIRLQERIRDDTLERQRRRGREALESP